MDQKALIMALHERKPAMLLESKRAFNATLRTLLRNMRVVFPSDVGLATLETEVAKKIKAKSTSDIPLMSFVKKVSETTGDADVAKMITERDTRVLLDPVVSIPILKSINIVEKWPKLSPENQEVVWQLLQAMVAHSMQYMVTLTASPEEMLDISLGVLQGKPLDLEDAAVDSAASRIKAKIEEKLKKSGGEAAPAPAATETPAPPPKK